MNESLSRLIGRVSGIGDVTASVMALVHGIVGMVENVTDSSHAGLVALKGELSAQAGAMAGAVVANTGVGPQAIPPAGSQQPGALPPVAGQPVCADAANTPTPPAPDAALGTVGTDSDPVNEAAKVPVYDEGRDDDHV